MKFRRRERTLTGVFVASLAALAVDRLLLSGVEPRDAVAADAGGALVAPTGPLAPTTRPATRPAPPTDVPDVFVWARLGEAVAAIQAAPQPSVAADTGAREFESAHTLDAVVLGERPMALVGGVALRVGDYLDGFWLREVRLGTAEFVSDGQVATLRLRPMGKPR